MARARASVRPAFGALHYRTLCYSRLIIQITSAYVIYILANLLLILRMYYEVSVFSLTDYWLLESLHFLLSGRYSFARRTLSFGKKWLFLILDIQTFQNEQSLLVLSRRVVSTAVFFTGSWTNLFCGADLSSPSWLNRSRRSSKIIRPSELNPALECTLSHISSLAYKYRIYKGKVL